MSETKNCAHHKREYLMKICPEPPIDEIRLDIVNRINDHADLLQHLIEELRKSKVVEQHWVSVGQTQLQLGLMALRRSATGQHRF